MIWLWAIFSPLSFSIPSFYNEFALLFNRKMVYVFSGGLMPWWEPGRVLEAGGWLVVLGQLQILPLPCSFPCLRHLSPLAHDKCTREPGTGDGGAPGRRIVCVWSKSTGSSGISLHLIQEASTAHEPSATPKASAQFLLGWFPRPTWRAGVNPPRAWRGNVKRLFSSTVVNSQYMSSATAAPCEQPHRGRANGSHARKSGPISSESPMLWNYTQHPRAPSHFWPAPRSDPGGALAFCLGVGNNGRLGSFRTRCTDWLQKETPAVDWSVSLKMHMLKP